MPGTFFETDNPILNSAPARFEMVRLVGLPFAVLGFRLCQGRCGLRPAHVFGAVGQDRTFEVLGLGQPHGGRLCPAQVVGRDPGCRGRLARVGALAQVMDDEQGEMVSVGNGGEESEQRAGAFEAGLAAAGGGGQRVDDDEGRLHRTADLVQQVLLVRVGQVDKSAIIGGWHEEEAARVDVPGAGALAEEGGCALGAKE
jgi:hypothetical protein